MKTTSALMGAEASAQPPTMPYSSVPCLTHSIERLRAQVSALLLLILTLAPSALWATELLQNGDFTSQIDHWNLPPELTETDWNPLTSGTLLLSPPAGFNGYADDVIYQPLNVPNAANKTVTASLKLRKSFGDSGLKTIAVMLEYVTTSDAIERVLAFEADNDAVTDVPDQWTTLQAEVVLPANARKLTKFIITKQTAWGAFIADDASLSATDLTPGAVPQITAVTGSGAFGSAMTLTGSDFGTLPGSVFLGSSAAGLTVQTWTATSVEVIVAEAAKTGAVRLIQDFTESWGGTPYYLTSPTLALTIHEDVKEVIKGTQIPFLLQVDFLNGFTSALGVNFTVPEAPIGIVSFTPVPLKNSGGVFLNINTTTLAPGTYHWTAQSVEADSPPRSAPFSFTVHTVASAVFRRGGTEVTSVNTSAQGELLIGFELRNSSGDLLPNQGCQFTSSNSSAVLALAHTSNGAFRSFAQDEGSANLQVTAPDGFTASLPITVTGMNPNRMTFVGFTNPSPNNSGTSLTTFSASAPIPVSGYGLEGMFEIDPADAIANISFGSNTIQSDPFAIVEGQMPNIFLFYASTSGGVRHSPLTVVNSPAHGSLFGRVGSLDNMGPHGAEGILEFFDPDDDSDPVLTREISNWQSADYTAGAIPPGNYKVRIVSGFTGAIQWYPNTTSFEEAQVLTLNAGQPVTQIHFFPPPSALRIMSQPRDQTVGLGATAQFQVVVDGAYSPFEFQWQADGADITNNAQYAGSDTATLTVTNAQLGDSGTVYSVLITDTNTNSITSRQALLTVGDFEPPAVTTFDTTHAQALVRAARAVVVGQVNPNGLSANAVIEWGTSSSNLDRTTLTSPQTVSGNVPQIVTGELTNLSGNTTYFYRVRASSPAGNGSGSIQSFKTPAAIPPIVKTLPASAITHGSVTLNGTVNARNADTTVLFEYGTTTALGSTVVAAPAMVSGDAVQTVAAFLMGLQPHTKHFFRIHASSDNGSAVGATLNFTTANRPPVSMSDSFALLPSGKRALDVLSNDTDPDGDSLIIETFTQTPAAVGKVTKVGNELFFAPSTTFTGGSFTYRVKDGYGGTSTSTVTLTLSTCAIAPLSKALLANGGTYGIDVTSPATWAVIENLSWVSAAPATAAGNATTWITVAPNTTTTSRTATLVIGGISHTLTQDGVLAPQITTPMVIPVGIVGGDYSLPIPTLNPPVTYTATGLPPGLAITQATGTIEGKPLRSGDYPVSIKAKNKAGQSSQIDFTIQVLVMPDHAIGSFSALVSRSPGLNDNLGGLLSFSTTATGSVSGSLRLGKNTHTFKGWLDVPLAGDPVLGLLVLRKALPGVILSVTLTDSMNGTVISGDATVDEPGGASATVDGVELLKPATDYVGYYTTALRAEDPTDETAPQGSGYLTLRIAASGKVTLGGKLADGTPITGSTALWQSGGAPLFASLYKGLGSILGLPEIVPGDPMDPTALGDVSGTLSWLKKPQTTRAYDDGFGPVALTIAGGEYVRPPAGEIVMGLPVVDPGDTNATIDFDGGGITDTDFGSSLSQQFRVTTAHKTTFVTDPDENPAKVKITKLNPSTGLFTGTLTLVDENPNKDFANESRSVTFQGVILLDEFLGEGFFLLGELSEPPTPASKMPQTSGVVTIY